jgi:RHS repeat-associated protein
MRIKLALLVLAAFVCSVASCSDPPRESESVGSSTAALTSNERILGFESVSDWSATTGTLAASTRVVEGAQSLAVSGIGYTQLTSAQLSSLGTVDPSLTVDLLLPLAQPNPHWYGDLQIYVDLPSQNLYSAYVGQKSLTGLALDTFHRLSFPLPADIRAKLQASYTDLRFRIVLNVPQGTGQYLLDRLFVGQQASPPAPPGPSGEFEFVVRLPRGVPLRDVTLGADGGLAVHDGVQVKTVAGAFTGVSNTGTQDLNLGVDSLVGNSWSAGTATLRNRARVNGFLKVTGALSLQAGAQVTGTTIQQAVLTPFAEKRWTVAFPSTPQPDVILEPDTLRSITPGGYGRVHVKSRARLTLAAGIYYFDELTLEPQAILEIQNGPAAVSIYVRTRLIHRGAITEQTPSKPNVLFGYAGTETATIEAPFRGMLVAPRAIINLASTGVGHTGSFFGKVIEAHQWTTIWHRPFERDDCATADDGCGSVFGCAPRDQDGDGLSDCDEETDHDPWTDPAVVNGLHARSADHCHAAPTCAAIDSLAEVQACVAQASPREEHDVAGGWDWRSPASADLCSPEYGFDPPWTDCGPDWQVDFEGFIKLDWSGQHCFSIAGDQQGACGSLFFNGATNGMTFASGVQCFDVQAGVYPIHWFYETSGAPKTSFSVNYCFAGTGTCTPQVIPARLLRRFSVAGQDLCDPNPTTCTHLCPCGPGQNTCEDDRQCETGTVCGPNNGIRFGKPDGTSVCWNPLCAAAAPAIGCGTDRAPCGTQCSDRTPCDSTADCAPDEVCGTGNGVRFQAGTHDVCWKSTCETDPVGTGCGDVTAPCGRCECAPNCAGKVCGNDASDGCGGICPGLCIDRQPGCQSDHECQPGSVCIRGGGPRIGLPEGTNVCLPARCASAGVSAPDCGATTAVCGTCTPCVPDCTGRSCGPDPRCGVECGAPCETETFCNHGQCVPVFNPGPALVPDGQGGFRPVVPLLPEPTSTVGAVFASADVTDRGSSSYTIPITVPPGRAGIEPQLALRYTSTTGNGALGIGWSLDGLSAIARCPKTHAHNGVTEAIRLSQLGSSTELCLDGQHLVEIADLGGGSKEYRTDIDTFVKVVSFGEGPAGPTHFHVRTRAGHILEYGATDNSRVLAKDVARAWAISRVTDLSFNSMSVAYFNHPSSTADVVAEIDTAELLPRTISYTGHLLAPADREVKFFYEGRSDVMDGHAPGGAPTSRFSRLLRIETWAQGSKVMSYLLGYLHGASGLSRLAAMTECAADFGVDRCKPPTEFTYDDGQGFEPPVTFPLNAPLGVMLDANGDARRDVAVSHMFVNGRWTPVVDAKTAWGISMAASIAADNPLAGLAAIAVIQFVNEWFGKTEEHVTFSRTLFRSTGSRSFPFIEEPSFPDPPCPGMPGVPFTVDVPGAGNGSQEIIDLCHELVPLGGNLFKVRLPRKWLFDFDGDGVEDSIGCKPGEDTMVFSQSRSAAGVEFPALGSVCTGTPACPAGRSCNDAEFLPPAILTDFDGDGVANLLLWDIELGWAALLPNPRFTWKTGLLDGAIASNPRRLLLTLGDFNGDGLEDIAHMRSRGTPQEIPDTVWLGTGTGYEARALSNPIPMDVDFVPWAMDTDRDRSSELVHANKASNAWFVRRVDTSGTLTTTPLFTPIDGKSGYFADIDGDGVTDMLQIDAEGKLVVRYGRGRTADLLTRVTDGMGRLVRFDYEREHDEAGDLVYRQGTGCTWPQRCLARTATPLVSSIEHGSLNAGIERRFDFRYLDAREDIAGRGWVGFGQRLVSEYDGEGELRSSTFVTYDNSTRRVRAGSSWVVPPSSPQLGEYIYPFAGLPTQVVNVLDATSAPLSNIAINVRQTTTDFNWELRTATSGGRPFPALETRHTVVQDFGDELLREDETFGTDGFGNPTSYARNGPESIRVDTAYHPADTTNWLISLPEQNTVESRRGTDIQVRKTEYSFYPTGLLHVATREPGSSQFEQTVTLDRDDFGNVRRMDVDAPLENPRSTAIQYDNRGLFPAFVTNAEQQVTQLRFDERHGATTLVADPNGIVELRSFDGFGRLRSASGSWGAGTITYEAATPSTSPFGFSLPAQMRTIARIVDGPETQQEIDSLGRVVRARSSGLLGQTVEQEFRFDTSGRVDRASRPHLPGDTSQGLVELEYDDWDRLVLERYPDNSEIQHQYTSRALLRPEFASWLRSADVTEIESTIDARGNRDVVVYDRYGNPLANIDAKGNASDYFYGSFNLLRRIRDAKGLETTLDRDRYGRVGTMVDPSFSLQSFTYNGFDELRTHTDALPRQTTYLYDDLGRVTDATVFDPFGPEDGTTRFTYDGDASTPNAIGRITEMATPTGQRTRYEYEPPTPTQNRGLLQSVRQTIDGEEFVTGYEYNSASQLLVMHYPQVQGQSVAVRHHYDPNGNLIRLTDAFTSQLHYRIDEADQGYRVRRETFGNTAETVRTYKATTGDLEAITTSRAGQTLQQLSYDYDRNGNMTRRRDHLRQTAPHHFGYDELDRLISEAREDAGGLFTFRSYAYNDPGGNITSKSDIGSFAYHPSRPYAVATAGANSYQYDNNGNQTHREGPGIAGGAQDITYTAFNLPRQIFTGSGPSSSVAEFDYDATEQRVAKRGASTTTHYVGDGYQRTRPASGTGPRDHRYVIYGPMGVVAQLARTEDGTTVSPLAVQYVHGDVLGSAQTVSDSTGQTRFQNFPPFGGTNELFDQSGIIGGFTGHEHDDDLGLVNMRGRIYDPALGRFLTPDPFTQAPFWTQGLNRYSYTWNNPLKYVDPSGFEASEDWTDYAGPIGVGVGTVGLITYGGLAATGHAGEVGSTSSVSSGPSGYGAGSAASGALGQAQFGAGAWQYLTNSPSFNPQTRTAGGSYSSPTATAALGGSGSTPLSTSDGLVKGWAPVQEGPRLAKDPPHQVCDESGCRPKRLSDFFDGKLPIDFPGSASGGPSRGAAGAGRAAAGAGAVGKAGVVQKIKAGVDAFIARLRGKPAGQAADFAFRTMPRPLPPGVTQAQFGNEVMRWGTGNAAARERIATLTREGLTKAGVTKDMARAWRDFYRTVARETPANPSAAGRADLMQRALELLK